jgi:hypothetical protein
MGDLPRRVPGRAGGQLGLFQQHDVAPALMGEMIGEPAAHDAAADDDDARVVGKTSDMGSSFSNVRWTS